MQLAANQERRIAIPARDSASASHTHHEGSRTPSTPCPSSTASSPHSPVVRRRGGTHGSSTGSTAAADYPTHTAPLNLSPPVTIR